MAWLLTVWDKCASKLFQDICRAAANNLSLAQSNLPFFFFHSGLFWLFRVAMQYCDLYLRQFPVSSISLTPLLFKHLKVFYPFAKQNFFVLFLHILFMRQKDYFIHSFRSITRCCSTAICTTREKLLKSLSKGSVLTQNTKLMLYQKILHYWEQKTINLINYAFLQENEQALLFKLVDQLSWKSLTNIRAQTFLLYTDLTGF